MAGRSRPRRTRTPPLGPDHAEALLETVLSSAPVGFAFIDRELRYVRINAHLAAINGIPADAHIGRHVGEVVPEIAQAVEPTLRKVLETGEPFLGLEASGAQLGRRRDARIWEANFFPVRCPKGTIIGVGAIITEVTERRRARDALQASEAELRALFGALSDVILVLDSEGRFIKIAPTGSNLLYWPAEELRDRRLHDVFPAERASEFLAIIRRALEIHEVIEIEYSLPIRGKTIWFAGTVAPAGEGIVVFVARDISARKRADEALRRQALVFETIGDAVLVMDVDGRIVDWNPAATRIFGYTKAEALGKHGVMIHHPDLGDRLEEQIQAALRRDRRWSGELPFRRKDGTDGVADVVVVTQLDDQGRPTAWIGVSRDITARRRAEAEVAESHALLGVAEELAHIGSWALELETGRLTWSDELYRIFGARPQSIPVTTDWFLAHVHPDDVDAVRTVFRQLVGGADIPGLRCRVLRLDGSERTLQAHGRVYRDKTGRAVRVLGSAQDLTEIIRVKRELRDALDTVKALVDASPLPVIALDAEHRVTIWNQAAERLFGWTTSEIVGGPLRIVSGEYEAEHARLVEQVLSGRAVSGIETRRQRKDGSLVDVYLSIAPLRGNSRDPHVTGAGDQVRGAVAMLVDMTEHRQLEEQLRQSQKMEAIGRLAGGVAHDFNNLLTIIKTYSELLLNELEAANPLRADVVEIHRAGGRASSLTRQLLAFSRKQVLQPRVLDLNAIVSGLEPMLRRLIGEDVRIETRPGRDLQRVRADPGQIEQVLMNLAVNARDAMANGGKLTIETANADLDENYAGRRPIVFPGKYVMLAVTDTGCGMDEVTRRRIFEPFFTTKEVGKGTGLGLSTVYGIVKQSGGYVWVYSEPGQGTTFKVYLPSLELLLPGVDEAQGHGDHVAAGGSEVVLLVEDEDAVRALSRRILERYGYTVVEAHDGRDALRVAGRYPQRIDIVVTDMIMPELNGQEVYRRLSETRPALRVLYISGYTDDDIVRRGLLDKRAVFLQKPFTAVRLAQAVRAVLDGREMPPEPTA